jgi:hypothetical protein
MSKPYSEFTIVQIKCPSDIGFEKLDLRPEHIPSTGDKVQLDGVWFRVRCVEWEIKHAMATVTIHLEP